MFSNRPSFASVVPRWIWNGESTMAFTLGGRMDSRETRALHLLVLFRQIRCHLHRPPLLRAWMSLSFPPLRARRRLSVTEPWLVD
jgi:hypothetical protein